MEGVSNAAVARITIKHLLLTWRVSRAGVKKKNFFDALNRDTTSGGKLLL